MIDKDTTISLKPGTYYISFPVVDEEGKEGTEEKLITIDEEFNGTLSELREASEPTEGE